VRRVKKEEVKIMPIRMCPAKWVVLNKLAPESEEFVAVANIGVYVWALLDFVSLDEGEVVRHTARAQTIAKIRLLKEGPV
jgi:hypothetical protein